MKAQWKAMAVGLVVLGSVASASAQSYGGSDGYRERGPDRERRYDRDRSYDRDRDYRSMGRDRRQAFDEREYLRCNPDVRRAVANGQMESASAHYRTFGQREGRRLSC